MRLHLAEQIIPPVFTPIPREFTLGDLSLKILL